MNAVLSLSKFVSKYYIVWIIGLAIVVIVAAVVAGSRDTIATTGLILFVAVILHNVFGHFFGYLVGVVTGLDKSKRRAISIEVGM